MHPWLQTKPKRKKYFALACPGDLGDSSDSELEEHGDEEEDSGSLNMGLTWRHSKKWKQTPLTVITEDSEITEYS